MVAIGSNLNSLVGLNALSRHQRAVNTALERLSTGKRINRASDDPAGMAAATKLTAHRVTLEEVVKQAEYGAALLDAADGGLNEITRMLTDLDALVVQAANTGGLSGAEREALQIEADSILQAIDHLTANYTFGGRAILRDGASFQAGDTSIAVPSLGSGDTGLLRGLTDLGSGRKLNLIDGDLEAAQAATKTALDSVNRTRASLGALRKYTLGSEIDAKRIELENTADAESKIVDADFAVEVANLVREQTLTQATITVLQMSQRQAGQVLGLLGG